MYVFFYYKARITSSINIPVFNCECAPLWPESASLLIFIFIPDKILDDRENAYNDDFTIDQVCSVFKLEK